MHKPYKHSSKKEQEILASNKIYLNALQPIVFLKATYPRFIFMDGNG